MIYIGLSRCFEQTIPTSMSLLGATQLLIPEYVPTVGSGPGLIQPKQIRQAFGQRQRYTSVLGAKE